MSDLLIEIEGGLISFAQAQALVHRIEELGKEDSHWHFNDCGCCVTLHGPAVVYVIGRDGGETMFPVVEEL